LWEQPDDVRFSELQWASRGKPNHQFNRESAWVNEHDLESCRCDADQAIAIWYITTSGPTTDPPTPTVTPTAGPLTSVLWRPPRDLMTRGWDLIRVCPTPTDGPALGFGVDLTTIWYHVQKHVHRRNWARHGRHTSSAAVPSRVHDWLGT